MFFPSSISLASRLTEAELPARPLPAKRRQVAAPIDELRRGRTSWERPCSAAYWGRRREAAWRRADAVGEADYAAERGRRGGVGWKRVDAVGWRVTLAEEGEDCRQRATLDEKGGS
jgi:hypothetical protein